MASRISEKKQSNADGLQKMIESQRPFSKINYWMMGVCLALIILGFLLMSGGGSDGETFNPDVFSARRIIVGPLLSFLGFLFMAFAIIYQVPKKK